MKKHVLFIHSAGPQGPHAGSGDLVAYLQDRLGPRYPLIQPTMPDPENPRYEHWKTQIISELSKIEGEIILVGHSLGGSVLLKYLSEEPPCQLLVGVCIIAAPFWGERGWKSRDFALRKNLSRLHRLPHLILFHSRDDEVVPFSHLTYYAEAIPNARLCELDDLGHLFTEGCPDLVVQIMKLTRISQLENV
ncbi:alpha/beta fold hydrolase [Larkinella bovis]|uniref:Alpha/beta fold hydrolase n=1 Tax=Larkinella bovis TaxID=683041 RepID=A0ABW0I750_9BACT